MSTKTLYYLAAFIGSIIGAYLPALWGTNLISFSSIFFSGVGAIIGIIIVWKFFS
ncbi:MAG: hypothetical protein NTZ93_02045 [Candidatus Beckwithbacteria bacterium]|nr:hypothetical protein [Candidatus Beckwithbacteria bacterium]